MNKRLAIGIDIGGTRTKMGLVDLVNGNVIQTLIYPTETKDERRFYNQIKEAVEQFSTTAIDSRNTISGIGMGIPGFVFANGVIDSTYGFIDFMEDYPMKELIEDKFKIPCKLDNDARVVALGEALYGAGKNEDRVLVMTLGTGLGIGFVAAGKLNEPQPYAHMAGHISITDAETDCYCGRDGCLESLVSGTGLCVAAEKLLWETKYNEIPLNAENIFKERTTNNDAGQLVNNLIGHLKTGIDNYVNIYAPNVIILGGGLAKGLKNDLDKLYNPGLLGPYKKYKARLTISVLEEEAGILGSAALFNS